MEPGTSMGYGSELRQVEAAGTGVTAMFVGRKQELSRLRGDFERAASGSGCLVVLSGEPGIGKTRLADELCTLATDRGFRVHWGRCWESGGAPTYWPWCELFESLAREGQLEASRLDGPLSPLLGRAPESESGDPERARFQLSRETVAALREASSGAPLLLVIDDLHAADQSSLQLLSFVARGLRQLPVVVLCTCRDVAARISGEAREQLALIRREGTNLPLGPLAHGEVLEMLSPAGLGAAEGIAERVYARTEGNPLFVHELLQLLSSQGAQASGDGALPIPHSVRETIRQRLSGLPDQQRDLLATAAVAGKEIDEQILPVASERDPAEVSDALASMRDAGLLVQRAGGRHAFSHVLIRDVLYADLAATDRAARHRRVAEAIEAAATASQGDRSSELAHHLLLAGPGSYEQAVKHAVAAARRAAHAHAHDDAAALLERAAKQVGQGGASASLLVCDLKLAEGITCMRAGAAERGQQACMQAVTLARRAGDAARLAEAALALGAEFSPARSDPTLIGLLREAREALPADDLSRQSRLLSRLAAALQPAQDPSGPVKMALEAVELARKADDPEVLLDVLYSAMAAFIEYTRSSILLPLTEELVQLCLARDDRPRLLRAYLISIYVMIEAGHRKAAEARMEEYRALARELDLRPYNWTLPMLDATLALLDGRFEEGLALAEEAGGIARRAGLHVDMRLAAYRFLVFWAMEDDDALETEMRLLSSGVAAQTDSADLEVLYRSALRARQGRLDEAAIMVERATAQGHDVLVDYWMGEMVTEAYAYLDDPSPFLGHVLDQLAEARDDFFTLGVFGFGISGPISRALGLAAATLGRNEEADAHFEHALERCHALGAPAFAARVKFDHAGALAKRGEWDRAAPLLAEALETAEQLGMPGLSSRGAALSRTIAQKGAVSTREQRSALSELAAGIAHEINTPLGALQSNAATTQRALGIIKDALADPELKAAVGGHKKLSRALEALSSLHEVTPEATDRIHKVVRELRSFARLDRAEVDAIDLRESLEQALSLMAHRVPEGVSVERELGDVPALTCHVSRVHDALHTLLTTAFERVGEQGRVAVATALDGEHVTVRIEDSGPRLSDDQQRRLFDPKLARGGSGLGMQLGLANARAAAVEHGGSLGVESAAPGTAWVLRFPRQTGVRSLVPGEEAAPAEPVPAASDVPLRFTLEQRGEFWEVGRDGAVFMLKDSRGLQILSQLCAEPGREFHALDLGGGSSASEAADTGDAGEVLDAEAVAAYRERVQALREELAEAEGNSDLGTAQKLREELEFITAELSRGVGLGGRSRRAGKASERARVAVQRRVRDAIRKIQARDQVLGRHLDRSVRTGTFCCYEP